MEAAYEFVYALHFFNYERYLEAGLDWDLCRVRFTGFPGFPEIIDIDTEENFETPETLRTGDRISDVLSTAFA